MITIADVEKGMELPALSYDVDSTTIVVAETP